MLKTDLHVHTLNSKCGHMTILEVLNLSRDRGLELIAVTDHGPAQGATIRGTFFDARRVPNEYDGVRMLKGLEGNVAGMSGETDLTPALLQKLDIVSMGLHPVAFPSVGLEMNTTAMLNVLSADPPIDMITHPDIDTYPLDMSQVVPLAAERGVILELNDTNILLGKTNVERARAMIELGRKHGALFAVNSDSHTWIELGRDDNMRQFLRDQGSPVIDIVNDWPVEKALAHFEDRKRRLLAILNATAYSNRNPTANHV